MHGRLENILALRLGGIGEVLAVEPALRALRARFPAARIALLAERPAAEAGRPHIDEMIPADAVYRAPGPSALLSPRFWSEAGRLAARLLRCRWDLFLDFHHLFARRQGIKPLLASLLSRAPRRIGFGDKPLLTDRVADPDDIPMPLRSRALLAPLGIVIDDPRPRFAIAPADREWVDSLLQAAAPGAPLIAVSPGSSRAVQRWGEERFREAARRLSARGRIVLVGTPAERELCARAAPEGAINWAGKTTLGRLAALLARCSLLLANDSGPLHVAHAVGTPVVGIFRPVERRRWGSYQDPARFRALSREGPGAETGATLPLIPVEEVVAAAEDMLDARPARP